MNKSDNQSPGHAPAAVSRGVDAIRSRLGLVLAGAAVTGSLWAGVSAGPAAERSMLEGRYFSAPERVTDGLTKAGEGYFAPDMRSICYQGVPTGYPFYQIYVQPFADTALRPTAPLRVSTGRGRTTCSWFFPDGKRLLFASSHLDPAIDATEAAARQQAEEDAKTGRRRRYQWDFDPWSEIFTVAADGTGLVRLTDSPGYDAECSTSPEGRTIVFVSDRDGDPDVYLMDADGKNVRQLTDAPGYDGGPFFSPDGRWICYRTDRLEKDMLQIHVMRADGSGDVAVTSGNGVHWAPYWHPTTPWLIWTGADHSDPNRRPNYDLWIARYEAGGNGASGNGGRADAPFRTGPPLRLTDHEGADVLPVFSPDGLLLMWTASRDEPAPGSPPGRPSASQLWVARPDSAAIERDLPVVGAQGARP